MTEDEVPKEIWGVYVDIAKDLVVCSATLRRSFEKLGSDPLEARALSQKVDQIEGKIDDEYLKTKGLLLKYGRDVDPVALPILKDLVESMEHVADSCDDTANYVRISTVAREIA